ncbi:MAG: hypothetical protein KAT43_06515 [Nanoarchaeota archaeon]|nr:hypothetical protein [Nanoarchaeota archaeon]
MAEAVAEKKTMFTEEVLERVQEICSFDPEGGVDLLRRKPVYELNITEAARKKISMAVLITERIRIGQTVDTYNKRVEAAKRRLWEGD